MTTSRLIRELWRRAGDLKPRERRPGFQLESVLKATDKLNDISKSPPLRLWIQIYDEYISWMLSYSMLLIGEMHKESPSYVKAMAMLSGAITSHAISIRRLVLSGHDVSAKQVTRSLGEYVDVALLIFQNSDLAEEFVRTDSEKAANEFWNKYVRKYKARKSIKGALAEIMKDSKDFEGWSTNYDEWHEWRVSEDSTLSMAAHPSYLASVVAIIPPGSIIESPLYGITGLIADTSIRTIRYSIISLADIVMFSALSASNQKPVGNIYKYDDKNELHRHVKLGRSVLLLLLLYLISNQDSPELQASPIEDSFDGSAP